jgi:hypothetical protein
MSCSLVATNAFFISCVYTFELKELIEPEEKHFNTHIMIYKKWFVLATMFCLLVEVGRAFVPPPTRTVTRHTKKETCLASHRDHTYKKVMLGHLERILPVNERGGLDSDADTPGLPKQGRNEDLWPPFTPEPVVRPSPVDTPGKTPGIDDWPPATQEPKIGYGSGPTDTPGLPNTENDGIPPFLQEPRVP